MLKVTMLMLFHLGISIHSSKTINNQVDDVRQHSDQYKHALVIANLSTMLNIVTKHFPFNHLLIMNLFMIFF